MRIILSWMSLNLRTLVFSYASSYCVYYSRKLSHGDSKKLLPSLSSMSLLSISLSHWALGSDYNYPQFDYIMVCTRDHDPGCCGFWRADSGWRRKNCCLFLLIIRLIFLPDLGDFLCILSCTSYNRPVWNHRSLLLSFPYPCLAILS